MNYKMCKILSWNCRGLGLLDKCNVVREVIRSSRCDVCLLQETKLSEIPFNYFSRFLPSYFNLSCVYNLADHSKGGILIGWKRSYEMLNSWSTAHTASVMLKNSISGAKSIFTVVYGPSGSDSERLIFIQELRGLIGLIDHPWILAGDLNLVRWIIDRSSDLNCTPLMDLFNDFIQFAGLVDIPIKNRSYTWSNKRPNPSFSRLD